MLEHRNIIRLIEMAVERKSMLISLLSYFTYLSREGMVTDWNREQQKNEESLPEEPCT